MDYLTIPGSSKETFALFHGTGGNEYSLLSITGEVNPHAAIVSFLGNEGSGKHRRYFKPLVNGEVDRDDFNSKIDAFLTFWDTLPYSNKPVTLMGYSNGANFILGLLQKRPDLAETVILMHPSNLNYTFDSGSDTHILITAGATDTLSTPSDVLKLANQLKEHFPSTAFKLLDSGHEVTDSEVDLIKGFNQLFPQEY